ncbi:MAG: 2-C-methyl-D-erythritol 2,4-cyclodiphosphate synthase [Oscillospiraceae bacterium]|nr:2-C-methyl-D-erythritol 2,4-cyclodiphosphate synthase [Oscillospiraceae bacterium]
MRVGFGYDVHRLKEGRKCILCGVEIPYEFGPDGHSDADVPVHALIDALFGAAALGDIGTHFPDTDAQYKNADSIELLKAAYTIVTSHGYIICNTDITIVTELPKLAPFIEQMRKILADALCTETGNISIKGTTEEKLGFIGAGLGISASAVVLLNLQ